LGEGRGLVNDQPGRRMTLMKLAPLPASPARNESQSLSSPLSAPLGAQVTEITFCSNCKALIKERGIGALVARLFRLFAGEAPRALVHKPQRGINGEARRLRRRSSSRFPLLTH
jgi:hypothetical protein